MQVTSRLHRLIQSRKEADFENKMMHLNSYLQLESPSKTDQLSLFQKLNSQQQYSRDRNGRMFEAVIADVLTECALPFKRQVDINKQGIIVGFEKNNKTDKCYHRIDFVVGDVRLYSNIQDFFVLSCKTSCRERWKQDDWSLTHPPRGYFLLTMGDDYPPSKKFQESACRRMITCLPKRRDDRLYKDDYDDVFLFLKRES